VARGLAPGNGALVGVVRQVVGRSPEIAGKPEPAIFREAVARLRASRPLFIGDRLDTDIAGARRAGIPAALVLTGVSRPADLLAVPPDARPDFILSDLRELHHQYPQAVRHADGTVRVGGAVVRMASAGPVSKFQLPAAGRAAR
jgi:glycerol-1-phosphatase